jgi:hypothetical protein
MATYVNDLRLKEISTGDESGTWGTSTNTNLELIGEALGYATQQVFSSDADATTTIADGASDPARAMYFKITSAGSLTATRTCTIAPNTISRVMFIENATTGSQSIAISQGSGASVTILTGKTAVVYLDGAGSGAAVVDAMSGVDPGVTDTLTEVLVAGNTSGGTNIELSTTDKVQFRDAAIYINSSVDGQLDIVADTEIQIATTTVDINGAVDVSGTLGVTGVATLASLVATTADINAGTIDGTVIGGTTAAAISGTTGQFGTSLNVDGTATINSFLQTNSANYQHKFFLADGTTGVGYIYSTGSTFQFDTQAAQPMDLLVNGASRLTLGTSGSATFTPTTAGHAVFNENGVDADFRVESSGNANMLFVDGGSNHVNIGTSTDFGETLNIDGGIHTSATMFVSRQTNDTGSSGVMFEKTRSTTVNGNTIVQNGDQLGYIGWSGNDGDQFIGSAYIIGYVDGAPGNNDMPTRLDFLVTADGSDSATNRMRLGSSGAFTTYPATGAHAVFNENSVDADFRVESNDNENMLFVDGGNNRVGIGKAAASQPFEVGVFSVFDIGMTINETGVDSDFRVESDTNTHIGASANKQCGYHH